MTAQRGNRFGMKRWNLFVAAMLLAFCSFGHAAIPASERGALMQLYASANGDAWHARLNWNGAAGTECTWFGITCDDAQAHVIKIELIYNSLTGSLPSIAAFTELQVFNVDNSTPPLFPNLWPPNRLTGSIPSLVGLTKLKYFSVENNALTGPIPPLSQLHALEALKVAVNQLTGSIPSVAGLSNLEELSVAGNPLTGSIPPLAGLVNLTRVWLSNTSITGAIPSLTGLVNLKSFDASYTAITGSIPSLDGLASLETFDVSRSTLNGTIGSMHGLVHLTSFNANACQLTGPIPLLTDLVNVREFLVAENRLSGPIPSLRGLARLELFWLQNNQLSGSIPELSSLSSVKDFAVSDNKLTGTIPSLSGLHSLQYFSVDRNRLTGRVPELSGQGLDNLNTFSASSNQLSGPLPALTGLATMVTFSVGSNRLSGPIPSFSVSTFIADNNALTGSIPSLASAPYLYVFNVSNNQLTGSLPSFDGLASLSEFNVSNNRLTGTIPDLSGLANLGYFDVAFNRLSGGVPAPPPMFPPLGSTAGKSSLCPNQLARTDSPVWDVSTGNSPWYSGCSARYANLDQFGLTGAWYDVDTSGQGIVIHVLPDLAGAGHGVVFGGWMTYGYADTPLERQHWYTFQGDALANSFYSTMPLYETEGGNFDAPPVVGGNIVGSVSLAFTDCANGMLHYHFNDGRAIDHAIALTRLNLATTCGQNGDNGMPGSTSLLSGAWYDPATAGQGFAFDISTRQNVMFGTWYTFAPNGASGDPSVSQRWYTLQNNNLVPGSTTIDHVDLYAGTGGTFDGSSSITTTHVGTAKLTFRSCSALTIDYAFTGGENNGRTGSIDLVRFGPPPPACNF